MKSIDIFCDIIDNYGDIGVVYRLAKEFRCFYEEAVIRVFLNKPEIFAAICNEFIINKPVNMINGIEYISYVNMGDSYFKEIIPSEIIIEAFGCEIPQEYLNKAYFKSRILLNLEYLSFENWTKEFHLKESLLGTGVLKKYFYMPGLFSDVGGVILDNVFLKKMEDKEEIRKEIVYKYFNSNNKNSILISIFSYECDFDKLFFEIPCEKDIKVIVIGEKSINSIKGNEYKYSVEKNIEFCFVDKIPQEEFDNIIISCDICFCRGEESFVRGLISGNPIIWHAYLQEEYQHLEKVKSYLEFAKKFFIDKKVFEKYCNLVYNYNRREFNSFNNIFPQESGFIWSELPELKSAFKKISLYIIEECNLVSKMDRFLQKN